MATKTAHDWTVVRGRRWGAQVLSGAAQGSRVELGAGRITVGSAADNQLVLRDDKVSRHHLAIEVGYGGARIEDLGSKNGTFIDQIRISTVVVTGSAVLTLGDSRIALVAADEDVPIQPSASEQCGRMVAQSVAMRGVFALIERTAPTSATVLIGGETGTGKELVAEAIHQLSGRAARPFVVVDCGAIPRALIESELFGHVRGAFTGATADRAGAFERADGGTLFLDEIGELELDLQPRLLRVLETGQVKRVGGDRMSKVDVRIVAATHRRLPDEVAAGRFRSDLYYRLAVAWIALPPLRDRREDLPLLVERFARELGAEPPPREIQAELAAHGWPGNVRELRNAVARYVASGMLWLGEHPPAAPRGEPAAVGPGAAVAGVAPGVAYKDAKNALVAEFTRDYLVALLRRHRGNVSAAAREAKLDRDWIVQLARRHGIPLRETG